MSDWMNELQTTVASVDVAKQGPASAAASPSASALRAAGVVWNGRGNGGKAATCADIAAKLARFGSYASPKQQAFAQSLVDGAASVAPAPAAQHADAPEPSEVDAAALRAAARSGKLSAYEAGAADDIASKLVTFGRYASDRQRAFARGLIEKGATASAPAAGNPNTVPVPKLWALMQNIAQIDAGIVKVRKVNGIPHYWLKVRGVKQGAVGKIEGGVATVWPRKLAEKQLGFVEPVSFETYRAALVALEADPATVIAEHGKATGSCGCCGRELTDPESIARGIGPVCIEQAGF